MHDPFAKRAIPGDNPAPLVIDRDTLELRLEALGRAVAQPSYGLFGPVSIRCRVSGGARANRGPLFTRPVGACGQPGLARANPARDLRHAVHTRCNDA
jgi:hypothetical protein